MNYLRIIRNPARPIDLTGLATHPEAREAKRRERRKFLTLLDLPTDWRVLVFDWDAGIMSVLPYPPGAVPNIDRHVSRCRSALLGTADVQGHA